MNFAAAAASHSTSLSWSPSSSSGVNGYNVYRQAPGGSYVILNPSPVSQTKYTDNYVQSGMTYYYVVTAVSSTGVESTPSDPVSVTIQ